mgnify:CR=1 FL=1
MTKLEIIAAVSMGKMVEFNQSKIYFIEGIQKFVGYMGFTEKQGNTFQILISWKDRKSLDLFLESDLYRIFHGAIITLSKRNSIKISKDIKNIVV